MVIKKEITNTDCNLWNINKNINPQTKRKILLTSPIYKKFEKICSDKKINKKDDIYKLVHDFCSSIKKPSTINQKDIDIYNKINDFCLISSPKKEIKVSSKKEIKVSPKKEIKVSSKKEIKVSPKKGYFNFFTSLFGKKDKILSNTSSLKSMEINDINIKNMKLIEYFKDINFRKDNCLELIDKPNQYLLSKNILLYKKIGTPSKYGIVYKSKNINSNYQEIPRFISKIQLMRKESKQELSIFQGLTDYAIKNNICHFPILYSSSTCNNIIRDNNYPELLQKAKGQFKNYSIMLYELANGDYYSFKNKYKLKLNAKIWKNIYEQIFMSIFIYHSLDLFHADTHAGNFLYTKIKPGGCFHYKINNVDYYIENIGYKWMIWDYGITDKLSSKIKYVFLLDYIKIFFHFMKYNHVLNNNPDFKKIYDNFQAGYLTHDFVIPSEILKIQEKIWQHLGGLDKSYRYKFIIEENKLTEYDWFKYFIDNDILFSKVPIGYIISSSIINKNSFKEYKIKLEDFK